MQEAACIFAVTERWTTSARAIYNYAEREIGFLQGKRMAHSVHAMLGADHSHSWVNTDAPLLASNGKNMYYSAPKFVQSDLDHNLFVIYAPLYIILLYYPFI